jgi:DNA-binding FadR family transcriptional regulator
MTVDIYPIESISLKTACIQRLESLILAGKFNPGERLPSERDLAAQLGVSRPVLHQAIVALDAKGLVTIEPRRGVFVSDFHKDGSIPLLMTLMSHNEGEYQPELLTSLMSARILIEVETARLAAQHRTVDDLIAFDALIEQGRSIESENITDLIEYDYAFHQRVAIASANLMYPMILNSLKNVHTNLAGIFYRSIEDVSVIDQVRGGHSALVVAIKKQEHQLAGKIMRKLLEDGEKYLMLILQA